MGRMACKQPPGSAPVHIGVSPNIQLGHAGQFVVPAGKEVGEGWLGECIILKDQGVGDLLGRNAAIGCDVGQGAGIVGIGQHSSTPLSLCAINLAFIVRWKALPSIHGIEELEGDPQRLQSGAGG